MEAPRNIPHRITRLIASALEETLRKDSSAIERLSRAITDCRSVFLLGAGRSGLIAKAFAMRLMHLQYRVHVAGECTTPRIQQGDLAIIVSASGATPSILAVTDRVSQSGAELYLITQKKDSPIGLKCKHNLVIPNTCASEDLNPLPLGSLFEISALVFLESAVAHMQQKKGLSESEMAMMHTILE